MQFERVLSSDKSTSTIVPTSLLDGPQDGKGSRHVYALFLHTLVESLPTRLRKGVYGWNLMAEGRPSEMSDVGLSWQDNTHEDTLRAIRTATLAELKQQLVRQSASAVARITDTLNDSQSTITPYITGATVDSDIACVLYFGPSRVGSSSTRDWREYAACALLHALDEGSISERRYDRLRDHVYWTHWAMHDTYSTEPTYDEVEALDTLPSALVDLPDDHSSAQAAVVGQEDWTEESLPEFDRATDNELPYSTTFIVDGRVLNQLDGFSRPDPIRFERDMDRRIQEMANQTMDIVRQLPRNKGSSSSTMGFWHAEVPQLNPSFRFAPLRFPTILIGHTRVPVYRLHDLLGGEELEELLRDMGEGFKGKTAALVLHSSSTLELQKKLLRLQTYLAEA